MAKFDYTAIDHYGATVIGVESARTTLLARAALLSRELHPVKLVQRQKVLHMSVFRRRVPRKELMHFSRQLAVFVRAGVPILDGLEVIGSETSNKVFAAAIVDIAEGLRSGQTFTEAASAHPGVFPEFYLGVLRSAEVTGRLDTVLDQLSRYIERDVDARMKIGNALIYPMVIMVTSVLTVAVLTVWVLPKFRTFFESLHAKLPLTTRLMLSFSDFLSTWGIALALGVVAAIIGISWGRRTQRGRVWWNRFTLRIPAFGPLLRTAILERFCRVMSSMMAAGVSLPEALSLSSDATNNAVYRRALATVMEKMLRGEGLATPLAQTELFPAAARQMIRVGEDTGTLDQQLEIAAMYFDRELDYRIKRFTALFEPAVIMIMGVVVGFVAIALVSAMYGIFNQVNSV